MRRLLVLALLFVACKQPHEVAHYPIPANAQRTPRGIRYVISKKGDGRVAGEGGIWAVDWNLISHRYWPKVTCKYRCGSSEMTRPVSDRTFDKDRDWLSTMREGEERRVWLPDGDQTLVYDVTMGQVIRTDAAGNVISDQPPGSIDRAQPYEHSELGPRTIVTLRAPASVHAYRVAGQRGELLLVRRYPVEKQADVPFAAGQRIAEILLDPKSFDAGFGSSCVFYPNAIVEYRHGSDVVDVLISFDCATVDVLPADGSSEPRVSKPIRRLAPELQKMLTALSWE